MTKEDKTVMITTEQEKQYSTVSDPVVNVIFSRVQKLIPNFYYIKEIKHKITEDDGSSSEIHTYTVYVGAPGEPKIMATFCPTIRLEHGPKFMPAISEIPKPLIITYLSGTICGIELGKRLSLMPYINNAN